MGSDDLSTPLAPFDPPVARAVVTLLRSRGVAAAVRPDGNGELVVLVAAGQRTEAFALLAGNMEQITELSRAESPPREPDRAEDDPDDVHSGRPLVLERLRNGRILIALILVPLLAVTLARPGFPGGLAILVLIGGAVLISAWRQRQIDRDYDPRS